MLVRDFVIVSRFGGGKGWCTPSPTGTPYQKELVESDAARNHPEQTAFSLQRHKAAMGQAQTPSLSPPPSCMQLIFALGHPALPRNPFLRWRSMKGLAKTWLRLWMPWESRIVPGMRSWVFLSATFAADLGSLHRCGF